VSSGLVINHPVPTKATMEAAVCFKKRRHLGVDVLARSGRTDEQSIVDSRVPARSGPVRTGRRLQVPRQKVARSLRRVRLLRQTRDRLGGALLITTIL